MLENKMAKGLPVFGGNLPPLNPPLNAGAEGAQDQASIKPNKFCRFRAKKCTQRASCATNEHEALISSWNTVITQSCTSSWRLSSVIFYRRKGKHIG